MRKIAKTMILILLICSSCNNKKHSYSDDLKSIEIPLQDMFPKTMVRAILVNSYEATIPIQLTNKQKEGLNGADFVIDYGDSTVYLKSDDKGIVSIILNPAILNKNPLIRISHVDYIAQEITYSVGGKTVAFRDGKSIDNEVIEYKNLPFIEQNGFRVYYTIHPDSAKSSFNDFYNVFLSVKKVLAKDNMQMVSPFLTATHQVSIIGEPNDIIILPVAPDSWEDKYWVFIHETVENELVGHRKIYDKNPNIRYIGDGLAEYISVKILESINPMYAKEMINKRVNSLNHLPATDEMQLQTWSHESANSIYGYAYSLAFWMKMETEYGEKAVLDFIHSFLALNDFNQTTVSALLSEYFKQTQHYPLTKKEAVAILTSYQTMI